MIERRTKLAAGCLLLVLLSACGDPATGSDPLPSWRDGDAKQRIVAFVEATVDPGDDAYRPPRDRIVVSDNDGTLWCEKPMYFQVVFALERLSPDERAALKGAGETKALQALIPVHADLSCDEMQTAAATWTKTARHARFERPYGDLRYQPMLELLDYLRANDFKVFIVTGGGIDFVRGISESAYDVPKDQVVGSSLIYGWDPTSENVTRSPKIASINDKAGKPPNIALHIGRRPIVVLGNSDGDLQMMQYADAATGPSLNVLLHHDDAEREYDYDHGTENALEQAKSRGWTVVSIKADFETVFAPPDD